MRELSAALRLLQPVDVIRWLESPDGEQWSRRRHTIGAGHGARVQPAIAALKYDYFIDTDGRTFTFSGWAHSPESLRRVALDYETVIYVPVEVVTWDLDPAYTSYPVIKELTVEVMCDSE